jgi:hypothetical protein
MIVTSCSFAAVMISAILPRISSLMGASDSAFAGAWPEPDRYLCRARVPPGDCPALLDK